MLLLKSKILITLLVITSALGVSFYLGKNFNELQGVKQENTNYITTRKRIDEAVSTPTSVDDARERLLARQKARAKE